MDVKPVAVLKRKSSSRTTNYDLCIFCQDRTKEPLRTASTDAKTKVVDCIHSRRKWRDISNVNMLDRLEQINVNEWSTNLKWHKNCHGSFTSSSNLRRIEKRYTVEAEQKLHSQQEPLPSGTKPARRSSNSVDWAKCMFCQQADSKSIHNVETLEKSRDILSLAQNDPVMCLRLSDVNDLIAAEGKYHLKCLVQFERKARKISMSDRDNKYIVISQLCTKLETGLSRGHVYDMGVVWNNYTELAKELETEIPQKYLSRKKSFYTDIEQALGSKANFVRPMDVKASLLMYPGNQSEYVISHSLSKGGERPELFASSGSESSEESSGEEGNQTNRSDGNLLQEMVHVAIRLRSDLEETPGHELNWRNIDQTHVEKIIPDSLYLFLMLLFGGTQVLEESGEVSEDTNTKCKVFSIAQDIVYGISNGKKLTPKHIGLALTLHQATRSENLVNMFHAANHCIPIWTVRAFDNAIANSILDRYKSNGYVYVPDNIKAGTFMHFSCDNIDVLESTIDGKNTFHCTQMMVWQRRMYLEEAAGQEQPINDSMTLDKETMNVFHEIDKAKFTSSKRPVPQLPDNCKLDMESWLADDTLVRQSSAINLSWVLVRNPEGTEQRIPLWGAFNESSCIVKHPVTKAGMLPILQAPADEYDTITTVINKFQAISKLLGQNHTVITADQPLYSKAKELVWANQTDYKNVIFCMGGLHVCFNYLRAIGQHMECAGLEDVWVETGIFAPNTASTVLDGKAYYRAVRGHLLTYEALWRLKWRMFQTWLQNKNEADLRDLEPALQDVSEAFEAKADRQDIYKTVTNLTETITELRVTELLDDYDKEMSHINNFAYWQTYLRMVEILLSFIRAQRTGDWPLHIQAFSAMLPWLAVYDHTNYARWGPVYLSEMKSLQSTAPEVYEEFMAGNFVVKRSNNFFNEVPADQATEWINKICKASGGIIGLTRNDQARDRLCVTWSVRTEISQQTKLLFGLLDDEEEITYNRNDSQTARIKSEEAKIKELMQLFGSLDVFGISFYQKHTVTPVESSEHRQPESKLVSIATKDVAGDEITKDLLSCENRGKTLVNEFTKKRLEDKAVDFFNPMKKNRSKTFAHLYKTTGPEKQCATKLIKADRKLLQRLFNAANSGRSVQIADIMKHELSPVPMSLVSSNGVMNSTAKSQMLNILTSDLNIATPGTIPRLDLLTCVIIDGHAMIQTLGKPQGCQNFGDYAGVFVRAVYKNFEVGRTTRVDVTFDRYFGTMSIKAPTRAKRTSKRRPIRKIIENPEVPLPQVWEQFISLDENKADFAEFLSNEILKRARTLPEGCTIVAGGGFPDPENAKSNNFDAKHLSVSHEEADTRMIIHAKDAIDRGYKRIVVNCRDTDVLLLLIYHLGELAVETWMVSGTSKQRRCFPVHQISLTLGGNIRQNILGFHAITGCDTTSSFHGISKKTCWKRFVACPELLEPVGRDGNIADVEKYLCGLYGCSDIAHDPDIDVCRYRLFMKARKSLELLPPTKDALQLHFARSNLQAKIWIQASDPTFNVEDPAQSGGWKADTNSLSPVWMRLPSVPTACLQLVTCGCKTKCRTARCKCYRSGQLCMFECACDATGCSNPTGLEDT